MSSSGMRRMSGMVSGHRRMSVNGTPEGQMRRVVVIGVGASGLCSLRHFAHDPGYDVVAFEQSPLVGGIWNYPEGCEQHPDAPPTSPYYCRTYRDLMTNSPSDLTHFPDFPLPPGTPNFVGRDVVCKYLQDYADHFDLKKFIKLRHHVYRVEPVPNPKILNHPCWRVTAANLETEETVVTEAEILLICNGHNGKPYIPSLTNIEQFNGSVIHSSQYRVPEPYENKNVMIVGAMVSANDISCALLPIAKKIILCRPALLKEPVYQKNYPHVIETNNAINFTSDGIVMQDGTEEKVDCVILATGFDYDFPFLTPECRTDVGRGRVTPLYRHLIHCEFHSMAFVGLLNVVPFLSAGADPQIRYYKAFVDGKIKLPSVEDMVAEGEEDYSRRLERGFKPHWAHKMMNNVWPYYDQLAKEAGFPTHAPNCPDMYKDNIEAIVRVPYNFRNVLDEKIRADKERRMMEQQSQRRASVHNGERRQSSHFAV